MPLVDHLQEAPKLPGNVCLTCRWYQKLGPEDKAFFDDWIENGYQNKQLLDICRKEGLEIDEQSFSRHIRRDHKRGK